MAEHEPDEREIYLTLHRTLDAPVEAVGTDQITLCFIYIIFREKEIRPRGIEHSGTGRPVT